MKTTALILVASVLTLQLFSQDTLYTKTGAVVNAKVVEINKNEIKYKKASNPDGPIYVMDVSDLVLIHFKNGSKEVFSSNETTQDNSNQNPNSNPTIINNNYPSNSGYVYGRPRVNVIVAPPVFRFNPWGWGAYAYYRPHYYGGCGNYHHYGHYGRRH